MGPRASLDGCEKSRLYRDSIPGIARHYESYALPTPLRNGWLIEFLERSALYM